MNIFNSLKNIDWNDLHSAAEKSQNFLRMIGNDKKLLRELYTNVEHTPELINACEIHHFDDKIVLHIDKETGIKLRLRLSKFGEYERIHNHRFSYSALYLKGAMRDTWYSTDQTLSEEMDVSKITMARVKTDRAGDAITISSQALHSSLVQEENTVALFMSGPAELERAIVINKETGDIWWRKGQKDESPSRREEVKMNISTYHDWGQKLEQWGLI